MILSTNELVEKANAILTGSGGQSPSTQKLTQNSLLLIKVFMKELETSYNLAIERKFLRETKLQNMILLDQVEQEYPSGTFCRNVVDKNTDVEASSDKSQSGKEQERKEEFLEESSQIEFSPHKTEFPKVKKTIYISLNEKEKKSSRILGAQRKQLKIATKINSNRSDDSDESGEDKKKKPSQHLKKKEKRKSKPRFSTSSTSRIRKDDFEAFGLISKSAAPKLKS